MLLCTIEFGYRPGMGERAAVISAELLALAQTIDGFVDKTTYRCVDDRVLTISRWRDRAALDAFIGSETHRRAVPVGQRELFTYYDIKIAELAAHKTWQRRD